MTKYEIPWIHLRNNYNPRKRKPKTPEPKTPEPKTPSVKKQKTPSPEKEKTPEKIEQLIEPEIPKEIVVEKKKVDEFKPTKPLGLKIVLHRIKDHVAASHLRVGIALLEDKNKIKDDLGYPCSRNTTTHNPLDNEDATGLLENINLGLTAGEKGT